MSEKVGAGKGKGKGKGKGREAAAAAAAAALGEGKRKGRSARDCDCRSCCGASVAYSTYRKHQVEEKAWRAAGAGHIFPKEDGPSFQSTPQHSQEQEAGRDKPTGKFGAAVWIFSVSHITDLLNLVFCRGRFKRIRRSWRSSRSRRESGTLKWERCPLNGVMEEDSQTLSLRPSG